MTASPDFASILTPRVWDEVRDQVLTLRNARILVAVSGGADSLALWQILRALKIEAQIEIVVAHINHQARGQSSEDDANFVADLCAEYEQKCCIERVQVLAGNGISFEMAARSARYEMLENIAHEENCCFLATGHTCDDQLETVLLHWLRGAAISGLRGIEASRDFSKDLKLIRPILSLTRSQTEAICAACGIVPRCDESNIDGKYLRNRVRHELVPLMSELSAKPRAQLARQTLRATQILSDDLKLLDEIAQRELDNLVLKHKARLLILDGLRWRELPVAMQRRTLRLAAQTMSGKGEISGAKIETAREWIVENRRRAVWQWTRDLRVEWTGAASGNRIRLADVRTRIPR